MLDVIAALVAIVLLVGAVMLLVWAVHWAARR